MHGLWFKLWKDHGWNPLSTVRKQNIELFCNNITTTVNLCNDQNGRSCFQITLSIFMSPEACPKSVRYICGCLQKAVVAKWSGERLVRTRVVSGFIFLRLLCPALLNPRQFGLVNEQPSVAATRSLVMVAKCLQNLANLVEFGGKVITLFIFMFVKKSCRMTV